MKGFEKIKVGIDGEITEIPFSVFTYFVVSTDCVVLETFFGNIKKIRDA